MKILPKEKELAVGVNSSLREKRTSIFHCPHAMNPTNDADAGGRRGDQRALLWGGFRRVGDLLPVADGRDRRGEERVRAATLQDLVQAHREPGVLGRRGAKPSTSQVG